MEKDQSNFSSTTKSALDLVHTDFMPHVRHGHAESKRFRLNERYNPLLLDQDLQYCQRPAKCQPLAYSTCMGSKLPYYYTTLDLTDLKSQAAVQEKLELYKYLR